MKKKIVVYVQDRRALSFLKKFFAERLGIFSSFYADDAASLQNVLTRQPAALIIEDGLLTNSMGKDSGVPVIALITRDATEAIPAAVERGAASYLLKPFTVQDLAAKLKLLSREQARIDDLRAQVRNLETIAATIQLLTSTLDPRELLFRIVRRIADLMPVTRCSMIRVDWRKQFAYVIATFEDPAITSIKLSLRKYPEILEALNSRRPVVIRNITTDPLMREVRKIVSHLGIRSILVIPVIFQDTVIGTLFLRTSRTEHSFTEREISLLNTIANASANTLYHAFLFEQIEDEKTRLEKLAITDFLTGIYNARYFYHRIVEEYSRAARHSLPLSCLMMDIDFFKTINDEYGHKTGDAVLREFAQLLKRHSRKSDVLARYGGEEFILMLPQTGGRGASAEAERLRTALRSHRFKGITGRSSLTMSIGIATFPHTRVASHDDLIAAADDALYAAKHGGRDRLVIFGQ